MIKQVLLATALMVTPVAAQEFYGGVTGGVGENDYAAGGIFAGAEKKISTGSNFYIGGLEVGQTFGDYNETTIDARVGVPVYDNVNVYGILGYGFGSNDNGIRMGAGLRYDIDERYFTGGNVTFQKRNGNTETALMARGGIKF